MADGRAGTYPALPVTVVPMSRMHEAIARLRSGSVIGRIAISTHEEDDRRYEGTIRLTLPNPSATLGPALPT